VWRGLSSDVTAWACGCLACQRGKIHCHTCLAPQPIPIPQRRFSHLHVDLVGPLQYSNNFYYSFTIIDRTSKMDGSCSSFRNVRGGMYKSFNFYLDFTFFGLPETITSDRWPQFTSVFGFNFTRCLTSHTNKQQLTTLSRTVQSKDCTAASMTLLAHAPPRQHGPRSYPLYSSDSECSRGKTLVFPRLRQFSVPKLPCQMNF
jgi:hypothetical protein